MRGLKVVIPFAACGFILSFVAGLFSHSFILSVLLKALISAILFGGLGFAIDMVFRKFLYEGSSDFQSDTSEGFSQASAASSGLGQKVDITIQDEELEPSESDNHFVVGEKHQMLNDSDVKNTTNESHEDSSQGFVPLRNFETVKNFSGQEAQSPFSAGSTADVTAANTSASETSVPADSSASSDKNGLDTLPDMENFAFGDGDSESDNEVSSSDSGSDFVSVSSGSKKQEEIEVKDAALMAKAISSVLSDENSM